MARRTSDYDVEIAGTGYMLAYNTSPDENDIALGRAAPTEQKGNVDYPASRLSTGEQGYENWPIEKEAPWLISDLSGGFGHHQWIPGSNTYWYGFVDARIPGKVLLPPERQRVGLAAANAERRLYSHFERTPADTGTKTMFGCFGRMIYYWDDLSVITSSLDLGTGMNPLSAANYQGVASALLTYVSVETTTNMPQPFRIFTADTATTAWSQDTQRTNVTPLAGIYDDNSVFTEDAADPIVLTLNSLQSTQDSVYVRDLQPFEGLVVTMNTTNSSASVITIRYWDGLAWSAVTGSTDGTISGGASFGQTGNITWTMPTDWQPNAVNGTNGYHIRLTWSANLDASVATTDIDLMQRDTAMFFAEHQTILYRTVRSSRGFELWSNATGGADATWTLFDTISDLSTPVTGMFSTDDVLWITTIGLPRLLVAGASALSDGIWPHPRTMTDSLNGIGANVWRGALWLTARQDLYRLYANTNDVIQIDDEIGPGRLLDNDSPVQGRTMAFVGDDYYGYAVIEDKDGVSYLLSWVPSTGKWHSLLNLGTGRCLHMWVSDVGNATNSPILYMHMDTDLTFFVLARNSPDPSSDSIVTYDNSTTDVGILLFGRFRTAFRFDTKVWLKGEVEADDLAAGQTILYSYRTVNGGAFTNLTTAWASGSVNSANFPTTLSGYWIEPRLTLATTTVADTPILRAFWLSYAVRLPQKPEFTFLISIKSNQEDRRGQPRHATAEQLLGLLETAMSASGTVTVFEPDLDNSVECIPQTQLSRRLKRRQTTDRDGEWLYLAVFTQHQATVFGTWGRMGVGTWGSYATSTWAQLASV